MFRYTALLLAVVAPVCLSGEISFEYSLDAGDVSIGRWMNRDVVSIPGGMVPFGEGSPSLPGEGFSFVLPQGCSITGVSVETHSEQILDGGPFNINSVQCLPISEQVIPLQEISIHSSDNILPGDPVSEFVTGTRTGFRIGAFVLVPFRYRPMSGTLSVISSATVTVEYGHDPEAPLLELSPRQVGTASDGLASVVDNPGMLNAWAPALKETDSDWSAWMVIGDAGMEEVLQPLVDHRGITVGSAEFVSLDWIYANYTGWDSQERIRNFLDDAYENHGLIYALIVGDHGETTRISSLTVGSNTLNNVSDLYYGDLDGSWDLDGDHLYGERSDGIDLYGDIYVGRFSSDVVSYVERMVQKTITYETAAPEGDWRTTAVLMGAGLWPDSDYWGSFVCDSISERLPSSWTIHKLYENPDWHPSNQTTIISNGASYATPQGHGWAGGIAWYDHDPTDLITNSNYSELTNGDMLCVFHSIACMSGELTNIGCIAERLMLSPWGGAVAVMFNSSYGWGTPPSTGPSEWLEIKFAEQMFVHGHFEVGVAQSLAKDLIRNMPGVPLCDWVMQENNLLGDPALLFASGQTGIEGQGPDPAGPVQLLPPSPNPSTGSCTFSWTGMSTGSTEIHVHDITGRRVASPGSGELSGATGAMVYDCTDDRGEPLPSGFYTVVLVTNNGMSTESMVIVGR